MTSTRNRPPFTVRDAVIQLLREFQMTTIFGNPGSTELPMFRDFPNDFRYVLALQEAVAVGMADGYAQASQNAALINLHSAVGVGHAMGNIFTAFKNNTPLVITAGQQARSILPVEPFLFSNQATELPKPYVKWSCEPARAEDVPAAIARAYYTAMQAPCGPTLVSVPVDDWDKPVEPIAARHVSHRVSADPDSLKELATALQQSKKPAFVVGAAVDRNQAWDEMVQLAEHHNALVWVSPMSSRCSFPESHSLFAGFLPPMREKIVALLQDHDLIVVFGAPAFTYHVEGFGPYIPQGSQLFQLVDDPNQAHYAPIGKSIVGNLKLGIQSLLDLKQSCSRATPQGRTTAEKILPSKNIRVEYLLQCLTELRPHDSLIVEEAPSTRPPMQRYLPIDQPNSFFTCASGGLGYSLPAAVGVALAKPDKKVIALLGDGSAMYTIQGLWSAAQLKLPITFIIVKNGRYQALDEFARQFGLTEAVGTKLPDIDFCQIAKAQGCDAVSVCDGNTLKQILTEALNCRVPTLVEVVIE